jgi:hypothetical protein
MLRFFTAATRQGLQASRLHAFNASRLAVVYAHGLHTSCVAERQKQKSSSTRITPIIGSRKRGAEPPLTRQEAYRSK